MNTLHELTSISFGEVVSWFLFLLQSSLVVLGKKIITVKRVGDRFLSRYYKFPFSTAVTTLL